jgi:hypothetical protein
MSDYQNQLPSTPGSDKPPTSTMAIVSLVAGIASWVILPFIAAIVAVITGNMAKKEIRESGGTVSGEGLAKAGVILGYVNLGLVLLGICLVITLVLLGPVIGEIFSDIVAETSLLFQ